MIAKYLPDGDIKFFDLRKLTPTECFRLMGVRQKFIDKLIFDGSPLSKSACYKLAGNSIVVDVLFYIYKNIWFFDEKQYVNREPSMFPEYERKWNIEVPSKVKVVTTFSGYDAQCLGMEMLKEWTGKNGKHFDYDLLAWSEFDPDSKTPLERQPAVIAHNLLFPQWSDRNLGDMAKADFSKFADSGVDLLTYSSPCQSISLAGKRAGMSKGSGTRSSMLWYTENAIRQMRPKFLLQENVAAILNKTNKADFDEWCKVVEDCGYTNYYKLLNARDYGVPQNRLRMFMLSVRNDLNLPAYTFPNPFPLDKAIKDIVQTNVDGSFFLKDENVVNFLYKNEHNDLEYRVCPTQLAERIKAHCIEKKTLEKKKEEVSENSAEYQLLQKNMNSNAEEKEEILAEARELLKEPLYIRAK